MKKKATPANKPASKPAAKPDAFFLNDILETYGLFIVAGLLAFLLIVLFSNYVFFDKLMLYKDIGSDTINYSWPEFYHYSTILHNFQIPKWTFNWGVGQNDFPANLYDIPGWLLYVVSPEKIPYILVYIEMLKMFLSGLFFFLFLRKINLSSYLSIIGAVLYTFTAFMTIGATWFAFTVQGCYLAFLLYGFELLRKDNNLLIFPIAVALVAAANPIYIYLDGLLLIGYLLIGFILNGFTRSSWWLLGKLTLTGLLGILISSILLIAKIYQIEESPRGSGNTTISHILSSLPAFMLSEPVSNLSFFLRMLGNDMTGSANSFKGWNNYLESPMQYCGLITLLLLPQLFVLAGKKLKIVAAVVLAVAVVPVFFIYFRCAIWLFTGTYFRTFSLFFTLVQILLALKAFELILKNSRVNLPLLGLTFIALLFIMFASTISNSSYYLPVSLFLLTEAILVCLIVYSPLRKEVLWVLPLVICVEVVFLSWDTFNNRDNLTKHELNEKTGYNDYTIEALKKIKEKDKGFFRTHKDYTSGASSVLSFNDGLIQNYCGTSSYNSFNSKYYVHFFQKMKLIDDTIETHWLEPLTYHPLLMQLLSGNYTILRDTAHHADFLGLSVIDTIHGLRICRSKYSVPLGVTYNTCIPETEMAKIGAQKDITILRAVVVNDSLLNTDFKGMKRLSSTDTVTLVNETSDHLDSTVVNALKKDSLHISHFSENHITGDITTEEKKLFFLSIPFDKGWNLKVDGQKAKIVIINYGFIGCMLKKGNHKIDLSFEPVYYGAGIKLSLAGILCYLLLAVVVFISGRKKSALTD